MHAVYGSAQMQCSGVLDWALGSVSAAGGWCRCEGNQGRLPVSAWDDGAVRVWGPGTVYTAQLMGDCQLAPG